MAPQESRPGLTPYRLSLKMQTPSSRTYSAPLTGASNLGCRGSTDWPALKPSPARMARLLEVHRHTAARSPPKALKPFLYCRRGVGGVSSRSSQPSIPAPHGSNALQSHESVWSPKNARRLPETIAKLVFVDGMERELLDGSFCSVVTLQDAAAETRTRVSRPPHWR